MLSRHLPSCRPGALIRCLLLAWLAFATLPALAQQVPITRFARFTGNVNFVATGGSLRTQADIDAFIAEPFSGDERHARRVVDEAASVLRIGLGLYHDGDDIERYQHPSNPDT